MDQQTRRSRGATAGGISPSGTDAKLDPAPPISKSEFEAIAAFRYAIRKFLRFSEQAARQERITPQQHQLLLAIKGFPSREHASVSELAERLQMRQHSMVGLIDRTETQGLVRREPGTVDRRQVFVHLTSSGESMLHRLAVQHRRELHTMRDALRLPY
ncbi:MAG TPA: MarR family transcriptional regulator [Ktedonobacterales bacterium]